MENLNDNNREKVSTMIKVTDTLKKKLKLHKMLCQLEGSDKPYGQTIEELIDKKFIEMGINDANERIKKIN